MKKPGLFFSVLFLFLLSITGHAQPKDSSDYFIGKWNVLLKGLPNGDTKIFVNFQMKDTALTGTVLDSTNTEVAKISKIDKKGYTVTAYFMAQGYDVTLFMEKKDEDHVTGNMLNMFDAEGDRVKESK